MGLNLFVYLVGRQASVNTEYRMKLRIAADGRLYVQSTRTVAGTGTALGSEVLIAGVTAGPGITIGRRPTIRPKRPCRNRHDEPIA